MATMTRSEYFDDFVWSNYTRFLAEPGSKSLAMNAIVPAYHVAEWIAAYDLKSSNSGTPSADAVSAKAVQIRDTAAAGCPEFALLEDVVTAYKHVVTRPQTPNKKKWLRFFTELLKVQTQATSTVWRDNDV